MDLKSAVPVVRIALVLLASFISGLVVSGQPTGTGASVTLADRLDRRVTPGSALDAIRRVSQNRLLADVQRGDRTDGALPIERFSVRMPAANLDTQDRTPIPTWFRAYLRQNFPLLPRQGRYQYPRASYEIFEWMLAHQNLQRSTAAPAVRVAARAVSLGPNVNISSLDERDSESSIAVDRSNPQILIAASNNTSGSGFQRQYASSNGGATWTVSALPFPPLVPNATTPATAIQCDPSVGFTTDGTGWTATLGIDATGASMFVQMYRSTDHGKTWTYVQTISNSATNDKEMLAIDNSPSSPHKDSIYVAWDVPGAGIRFSRSNDAGKTWKGVTSLSTDQAIGVHVATGPTGEVYVAWPDTNSRQLKIRRSSDAGASFGPVSIIATTKQAYEISIPAMCDRHALIYLTLGVDKSSGPRKGTVYATWTDLNGTEPGCSPSANSGNASVFWASSGDGARWSTPSLVRQNAQKTDQFNPWMDVDEDGSVHVVFYDTRDDPQRLKTHLYYLASFDGGKTWINETRVTTAQTDETTSASDPFGNQYGDYNGLVVFRGIAHPIWTDRRANTFGGKEQVLTATIQSGKMVGPTRTDTRRD